jgi:hypothetical protein
MDPAMLEPVNVRVLSRFGIGDRLLEVGDVLILPKHRALYAAFLQLVTLDVNGEAMNQTQT